MNESAARSADGGFTLIETLVALAILALSAVAMLGATEAHIARIADLESRAAGQWAAENMLAELALGLAPEENPLPLLGIGFVMAEYRAPTADPDLVQVNITATDASSGRAYARLTGFLDTGVQR